MGSLLATRPAAAVFDVDGLLMDTEPRWTVAETALFARRGLPFGAEEKALLIGRSLSDACAALAVHLDEPEGAAALEAELLTLVTEALAEGAEPMPGAAEVVAEAAARVPVAAASNSPSALMSAALRRGGLADRFPVTLSAEDVPHPKPAPDMYSAAAAALGIPAARCVAFEDSRTGVRAAAAAGVPCVGVPTLPGVALDADATVPSLTDGTLLAWIRSW